mmetsp:Transcript_11440/g.10103  ORF Transcript_11440/g.10103 Transcript_11440/m.10103 type:complete len:276 (+) Transcript_11440:1-828(+)
MHHNSEGYLPKQSRVDFKLFNHIDKGKKRLFETESLKEPEHSHNYGYYFIEDNALINTNSKISIEKETEDYKNFNLPQQHRSKREKNILNNHHSRKDETLEKYLRKEDEKIRQYQPQEEYNINPIEEPILSPKKIHKRKKKLRRIVLRRVSPEASKKEFKQFSTLDQRSGNILQSGNSRSMSKIDNGASHLRNRSLDSSLRRAGAESILASPHNNKEKLNRSITQNQDQYSDYNSSKKYQYKLSQSVKKKNPIMGDVSRGFYVPVQKRHYENAYS